jgi:hypothetical protein
MRSASVCRCPEDIELKDESPRLLTVRNAGRRRGARKRSARCGAGVGQVVSCGHESEVARSEVPCGTRCTQAQRVLRRGPILTVLSHPGDSIMVRMSIASRRRVRLSKGRSA